LALILCYDFGLAANFMSVALIRLFSNSHADLNPSYADLWFLPLGGTGEIGMNMNLYGHAGSWLMVDCGVTFQSPLQPEYVQTSSHTTIARDMFDVVSADPSFISSRKGQLAGIVITHAHEDHIGALP
jgi:ribonuclease J